MENTRKYYSIVIVVMMMINITTYFFLNSSFWFYAILIVSIILTWAIIGSNETYLYEKNSMENPSQINYSETNTFFEVADIKNNLIGLTKVEMSSDQNLLSTDASLRKTYFLAEDIPSALHNLGFRFIIKHHGGKFNFYKVEKDLIKEREDRDAGYSWDSTMWYIFKENLVS